MKLLKLSLLILQLVALTSSNESPSSRYSFGQRRTSETSRQLQLVLDSPLATENEELSYSNESNNDESQELNGDQLGDPSLTPFDSAEIEHSNGTGNDEMNQGNSSEAVKAPHAAKRHPPSAAPTQLGIVETPRPSPASTKSSDVAETPFSAPTNESTPPSPVPTKIHIVETPYPSSVRTQSTAAETPYPSPAPTKLKVVETPYPSPAPTKFKMNETPYPTSGYTQSTAVESPLPSYIPTKSPVAETAIPVPVPRTERPTRSRDTSKPEEKNPWINDFDESFSQHSTPTFSPQTSSESESKNNHALEKEAEEFVEDPYVRVATLVFGVICVTLLIVVAQQMVENPDGLCAKLCRWTVAFFRVLCYPCILCLCCHRNKSHHTHTLVSTDGFDDYDHDLSLA